MKALLLILALFGLPASAAQLKPLLSCTLEDGSKAALLAKSHGLDGNSLYVRLGDTTTPAFQDMPETEFIGEVVLARCINKVLIFALNYGPPYLKGVAIRKNPDSYEVERIYFAEKALPKWLYTSVTGMQVVIPNEGFETDKKYIVYRFDAGIGQPDQSTGTDRPPVSVGYSVSLVKK